MQNITIRKMQLFKRNGTIIIKKILFPIKKPSFTNRKQLINYKFASFEISTNLNKKVIFNIMCQMDHKRVVFLLLLKSLVGFYELELT